MVYPKSYHSAMNALIQDREEIRPLIARAACDLRREKGREAARRELYHMHQVNPGPWVDGARDRAARRKARQPAECRQCGEVRPVCCDAETLADGTHVDPTCEECCGPHARQCPQTVYYPQG